MEFQNSNALPKPLWTHLTTYLALASQYSTDTGFAGYQYLGSSLDLSPDTLHLVEPHWWWWWDPSERKLESASMW